MAMTEETSRRSLLTAGVGALAGLVAFAFGRPPAATARDGDTITIGSTTGALKTTGLVNYETEDDVFYARSRGDAPYTGGGGNAITGVSDNAHGVHGTSVTGIGVYGSSTKGTGVSGVSTNGRGVLGNSFDDYAVVGHTDGDRKAGILGEASQLTSSGVVGVHTGRQTQGTLGGDIYGVLGVVPNTPGRVAVGAFALEQATALRVDGKATFSRSGKASLPRGRSYVDVDAPGGLDAASLVLAVSMFSRPGVFVQAVSPNPLTGKFRIVFNKIASSSSSTPVAWFIVN